MDKLVPFYMCAQISTYWILYDRAQINEFREFRNHLAATRHKINLPCPWIDVKNSNVVPIYSRNSMEITHNICDDKYSVNSNQWWFSKIKYIIYICTSCLHKIKESPRSFVEYILFIARVLFLAHAEFISKITF